MLNTMFKSISCGSGISTKQKFSFKKVEIKQLIIKNYSLQLLKRIKSWMD
jgi:hypothetical protein